VTGLSVNVSTTGAPCDMRTRRLPDTETTQLGTLQVCLRFDNGESLFVYGTAEVLARWAELLTIAADTARSIETEHLEVMAS